jgi:type I restriction enzyme S subunit
MKHIGHILTRNKTPVTVLDDVTYKQVTIRTNYKGVILRGSQNGSSIGTKNQSAVSAGQFILSRIDARNGAFGIVPEELEGAIVTNDFLAFDINEDEVEREFFNVFLQAPQFLEACIKASRGNTNRKRVDEDFFLNYQVNLPPLAEQHEIIKQINKGRTKLAAVSAEITHQQSLLAKLKQAILLDEIQCKLTADWRASHPDVEPASQLLHRIQAEKARLIAAKKLRPEKPLPKITLAEIPFEIPKGWEWCRLKELGRWCGGGTPTKDVDRFWGDEVPWITPKDMKQPFLSDSQLKLTRIGVAESSAKLIPEKSILFVVRGMILAHTFPVSVNLVETTVNQDMKAIMPFQPGLEVFLRLLLQSSSQRILSVVTKSTHGTRKLETEVYENFVIPIPRLAEQAAIVERVEALMTTCRALEAEIEHARTHAAHLLQAVLKEAFAPASA